MAADLYDTKKAPVYGRVTSSVRHLLLAVVALAGCEVAQSDEHATMYLAGYDHCLVTMAEDGAVEANKADGSTPAEILYETLALRGIVLGRSPQEGRHFKSDQPVPGA